MTTDGLVSVVVPCFNVANYVDDAIRSIQEQTYPAIEIIVVNDGSTDQTQQHLDLHAKSDDRIRIVSQQNRGVSSARNAGLRLARGEFVCFLDADDVLLPDKTEKQVLFLRNKPDADLVYSDYFDGDARLDLIGLVAIRIPDCDLIDAFACRNWLAPHVCLVRRELLKRVGEFDETLHGAEDWDFWIRCAKAGRFGYLPGTVAIYRSHAAQSHHNAAMMFAAGMRVIKKQFRSDSRRYRKALAAFYEVNAKYRWNARDHFKTGLYMALSVYNNRLAAAFTHLAGSR